MNDDLGFSRYLASLPANRKLDAERERQLAERWIATRDPAAARELVESHLRFVVKVARGLSGYGFALADLVAEGNVGLLEALQRFEPDRGVRFLSYAAWWIRAFMLSYVQRHWSIVRVSTPHKARLFFRLTRARARIVAALGASASREEVDAILARELASPVQRIREMTAALTQRDLSLDAPAATESQEPRLVTLAGDGDLQEEEVASLERARIVRSTIQAMSHSLSQRERYLLRHRLLSDEPQSLIVIGQHLGVSRERARQLESALKEKLRDALAELAPERRAA